MLLSNTVKSFFDSVMVHQLLRVFRKRREEYSLFGGLGQSGSVDSSLTANDVATSRMLDHHIRTTVYELSNFVLRCRGLNVFYPHFLDLYQLFSEQPERFGAWLAFPHISCKSKDNSS